jgi:hypothetical protein
VTCPRYIQQSRNDKIFGAYSIQTFDQQLYAIAKQVEWAKQETFKTHILRLGGFHTMSCFIASIGKLWGDGGLKDLLIES